MQHYCWNNHKIDAGYKKSSLILLQDCLEQLLLKKGKRRQALGGLVMQITGECDSPWFVCPHPDGMLSDATNNRGLALSTRFVLPDLVRRWREEGAK
jgi:hypothetical protein